MQTANEKRLYRVVFDEIHKVITDIGYREAFNLFPRLNLAGVALFGSSASIPDHLVLALTQLTNTPWRVIRTPSNRKELVYGVRHVPQDVDMLEHIVQYWNHIEPKYKPLDRCLLFCRTISDAKKIATHLNVLPFHSECEDDAPVEKFRTGEQKILPTTIRLGCGFHYEQIRHVFHYDLAYSIIDQYQEDSRGGRDGLPCHAITFIQENRPCPPDKGPYDLGVKAVWEWSRKLDQCFRIIPSQFLDGVPVTCDLVPGAHLCVFCQKECSKEAPPRPILLPTRPILRLTHTPSISVTPLYTKTPQPPRQEQAKINPPKTTTSPSFFWTPLRKGKSKEFDTEDLSNDKSSSQSPFASSPISFGMESSPPPPHQSTNKRPQDSSVVFYPPSKRGKVVLEKGTETRYILIILKLNPTNFFLAAFLLRLMIPLLLQTKVRAHQLLRLSPFLVPVFENVPTGLPTLPLVQAVVNVLVLGLA